jgi:hypothetical protein
VSEGGLEPPRQSESQGSRSRMATVLLLPQRPRRFPTGSEGPQAHIPRREQGIGPRNTGLRKALSRPALFRDPRARLRSTGRRVVGAIFAHSTSRVSAPPCRRAGPDGPGVAGSGLIHRRGLVSAAPGSARCWLRMPSATSWTGCCRCRGAFSSISRLSPLSDFRGAGSVRWLILAGCGRRYGHGKEGSRHDHR